MRIKPNYELFNGSDHLEEGKVYDVSEEDGRYFVGQGWASVEPSEEDSNTVTLEVHNSSTNPTSEV